MKSFHFTFREAGAFGGTVFETTSENWPDWIKVGQRVTFKSPDMSPHYMGLTYDICDVIVTVDWNDGTRMSDVAEVDVDVYLSLLPNIRNGVDEGQSGEGDRG